MALVIIAKISM